MNSSEVDASRKNLLRRLKELDQFKHSGSVQEGEIEKLQEFGIILESPALGNLLRNHQEYELQIHKNQKKKKIVKQLYGEVLYSLDKVKTRIKEENENLDRCEKRFRKYNIPKRYQNGHRQPLKAYLERLQEFMELNWRSEVRKNREKGYLNLCQLLIKMGVPDQEDGLFAFDCLVAFFQNLIGVHISNFFNDYLFLIIIASNESKEVVSLRFHELKTVLECLSLEEKYGNSIVINTCITVLCFFMHAMGLAGPFWDNEKNLYDDDKGDDEKSLDDEEDDHEKKTIHYLDEEMEDDVLHLIIMEVLRSEVSFCSPDFMPTMTLSYDMLFSMSMHLQNNVFNDKLERVLKKLNEWKCYILAAQETDPDDTLEMMFLWQVLVAGVYEICTDHDNSSWTLVNLVVSK